MRYTVTDAETLTELAINTRELIKQGWHPIGGVAVSKSFTDLDLYIQALIREIP